MHVRGKIELMIGFAMELAAWMFVGAVGIVILGIIMRCIFFLIEFSSPGRTISRSSLPVG